MPAARIRYRTIEIDGVDIHLRTLRDCQQFSDDDRLAERLGISSANWPMFGVVWDSSEVLAHLMADFDIEGLRILEVGCGIGLSSLLLNHRGADITATDRHPEAGRFLELNAELNTGPRIPFVRASWDDPDCGLGLFDLIIGSDIIYETEHVAQLSGFIDRHAASRCEVIIVDPGRGNHARVSKTMVALGYTHSQSRPVDTHYLRKPFRGQILRYSRQPQPDGSAVQAP